MKSNPITVSQYSLDVLAEGTEKNEIFLETQTNTQIRITAKGRQTIISLPYGNKFDIIDGQIIIHEK